MDSIKNQNGQPQTTGPVPNASKPTDRPAEKPAENETTSASTLEADRLDLTFFNPPAYGLDAQIDERMRALTIDKSLTLPIDANPAEVFRIKHETPLDAKLLAPQKFFSKDISISGAQMIRWGDYEVDVDRATGSNGIPYFFTNRERTYTLPNNTVMRTTERLEHNPDSRLVIDRKGVNTNLSSPDGKARTTVEMETNKQAKESSENVQTHEVQLKNNSYIDLGKGYNAGASGFSKTDIVNQKSELNGNATFSGNDKWGSTSTSVTIGRQMPGEDLQWRELKKDKGPEGSNWSVNNSEQFYLTPDRQQWLRFRADASGRDSINRKPAPEAKEGDPPIDEKEMPFFNYDMTRNNNVSGGITHYTSDEKIGNLETSVSYDQNTSQALKVEKGTEGKPAETGNSALRFNSSGIIGQLENGWFSQSNVGASNQYTLGNDKPTTNLNATEKIGFTEGRHSIWTQGRANKVTDFKDQEKKANDSLQLGGAVNIETGFDEHQFLLTGDLDNTDRKQSESQKRQVGVGYQYRFVETRFDYTQSLNTTKIEAKDDKPAEEQLTTQDTLSNSTRFYLNRRNRIVVAGSGNQAHDKDEKMTSQGGSASIDWQNRGKIIQRMNVKAEVNYQKDLAPAPDPTKPVDPNAPKRGDKIIPTIGTRAEIPIDQRRALLTPEVRIGYNMPDQLLTQFYKLDYRHRLGDFEYGTRGQIDLNKLKANKDDKTKMEYDPTYEVTADVGQTNLYLTNRHRFSYRVGGGYSTNGPVVTLNASYNNLWPNGYYIWGTDLAAKATWKKDATNPTTPKEGFEYEISDTVQYGTVRVTGTVKIGLDGQPVFTVGGGF